MVVYRVCPFCDELFHAELEKTEEGLKLTCPYCGGHTFIDPYRLLEAGVEESNTGGEHK